MIFTILQYDGELAIRIVQGLTRHEVPYAVRYHVVNVVVSFAGLTIFLLVVSIGRAIVASRMSPATETTPVRSAEQPGITSETMPIERFAPADTGPIVPTQDVISQAAMESYAFGNRKLSLGDHLGAIGYYDRAIHHAPTFAKAYANRGAAKVYLGEDYDAIIDLTQAIELDPNDALAYGNRAMARDHLGDFKGAVEDHSRAIDLVPSEAANYVNRAQVKIRLGDYQGAVDDCTKALELPRNDLVASLAYRNRASARLSLGDQDGADKDFDEAEKLG